MIEEILEYIKKYKLIKKFRITKNISAKKIAKELVKGNIVGRCSGRMEFGLRSWQ